MHKIKYIQVRKLFMGGNYSRAETIRGNTVFVFIISEILGKKVQYIRLMDFYC